MPYKNEQLTASLRDANRWTEQRNQVRATRDECSRRIQLELVFSDQPLTAAELSQRIRLPVDLVWSTMLWLESRGWIKII